MSRAPKTLMEHAYVRSEGSTFNRFKDTGRVTTLLMAWAVALDDLGRDELTIEAFVEWAEPEQSRRTTFRQLATFRQIFKGEANPNRLARALRDEANRRSESLDATFSVPDSLFAA